jgi:Glutamine amidotransferase domain
MNRFCGALGWAEVDDTRGTAWASMVALLGDRAQDCSARPVRRVRVAAWTPDGKPMGQAALCTAPGVTVLFSGYLRELPPASAGEAEFVLSRYRAGDWTWLGDANGVFAFAIVDAERNRCVLGVDRLGIRPLLYTQTRLGIAFSSDLAVLTRWHDRFPGVDYDAVQELVTVGFPLGNRTLVREVESVPPGAWVEIGPTGSRVTRYWSVESLPAPRPQSTETFLDEGRERLQHALRRLLERCSGGTLCLLSSGYDSRRILLEAHALGARVDTITAIVPYPWRKGTTIEPTVVGELCRRLGITNRMVGLPGAGARNMLWGDRNARDILLDGQVAGRDHIWSIPLVSSIPPSHGVRNFDGMAGDTLFNNPYYFVSRRVWGRWRPERELLEAIAPGAELADQMWGGLVSRSLVSRLTETLNALPEGPYRLSWFYLLGRTRRIVALFTYGLIGLRVESFCPYLDNDVLDHAHTMDPILKGELRMQKLALQRHFPVMADIPSSHSAPTEVPAAYWRTADFADTDASWRLTAPEFWRLARTRAPGRHLPRVTADDLAFAGVSALGLSSLGGRWREPRVRSLLHALGAIETVGATMEDLRARRARAWKWLERARP